MMHFRHADSAGRAAWRAALVALGLGLAAPAAQAKLYKWVDQNGNVTYSQQPPSTGEASSEAQVIELKGIESPDPEAGERLDEQREESEEAAKDEEFAKTAAAEREARERRIKENCRIARENLRILKNSSRIKETDAEGKSYFLDPEAIVAKTAEAEQQVEEFCN